MLHFESTSVHEYEWDVPSPRELLLLRKLSDLVYEVETTFTSHTEELSTEQALDTILDASSTIRKYISEHIGHLFDERQRMEYRLSEAYRPRLSRSEFEAASLGLEAMNQKIEILINCEYVWSVAEIFWLDAATTNPILMSLKFLDVLSKFRSPTEYDLNGRDDLEFGSDAYWKLLYKNAIFGKLDVVISEISRMDKNAISPFSKNLVTDLCGEYPLFLCLAMEDEDEEELVIPSKEDVRGWKQSVQRAKSRITEQRLSVLLRILNGEMDAISAVLDGDGSQKWLDWLCGYLLFKKPWMNHAADLRSLLTLKTDLKRTEKGSMEWMFGCIMTKEHESLLRFVSSASFPRWFGVHLSYFVRRAEPKLVLRGPREREMAEHGGYGDDGGYNEFIEEHPKMTMVEWVFCDYVENMLLRAPSSWMWLKNYLFYFKRRGAAMLSAIFDSMQIANDKTAYLMLQTVDEFSLSDDVFNRICLRMAHKAYAAKLQYGRIAYWCCKCRVSGDGDGDHEEEQEHPLNQFLSHLLSNYLDQPAKHINTLHDVMDNADIDESSDGSSHCKSLSLLSKLRDMYLCRYDLQKLDIARLQSAEKKVVAVVAKKSKPPHPLCTPFSDSRGHLIAALSKPQNAKNRNLKKMADSFPIQLDDDENKMEFDHDRDDRDDIEYPKLVKMKKKKKNKKKKKQQPSPSASPLSPDSCSNSSVFPKSLIKQKEPERASSDFLLHLVTPPRPTPSRRRKDSHRKWSHKESVGKTKKWSASKREENEEEEEDGVDADEEEEDEDEKVMDEEEKSYMVECCDIIISYTKYLVEIVESPLFDLSHFVRMMMFSLPMLSHEYAPNAIAVADILAITHKWYHVKFTKNKRKTGIERFDKKHELRLVQQILAHLQSKVLAATYSKQNYAEIWKKQEEDGHAERARDEEEEEEEEEDQDDEDDEDDDIIDID